MDRKRPVLGGSVRFPQYLGWSWTGCGPRLPVLGAKNRTELDLRTLPQFVYQYPDAHPNLEIFTHSESQVEHTTFSLPMFILLHSILKRGGGVVERDEGRGKWWRGNGGVREGEGGGLMDGEGGRWWWMVRVGDSDGWWGWGWGSKGGRMCDGGMREWCTVEEEQWSSPWLVVACVHWYACNTVEVSAKCKTQHKTKVKASELNSVGLSGSESARQRFFGLLEVRDVE